MDNKLSWILKYNKEHNDEYRNFTYSGQYLAIQMSEHHKARPDGYVYIHQLQAEKKLGRKLKDGECVHHIDGNKFNNDLDNLMVFKTVADHTAFHGGSEIYLDGDIWAAIFKEIKIPIGNNKYKKIRKDVCPICNTNLKDYSSKMCKPCYLKSEGDHLPSKETLTELILNYPMLHIGKMYGVSDRAVRKWCKKYDLPSNKKGILDLKNKLNQKASA
jgi:hypothetical protein